MAYSKYWKVIQQFAPLNDLHANICTFQIGAVQTERLHIFVQLKFVREKFKWAQLPQTLNTQRRTGKW